MLESKSVSHLLHLLTELVSGETQWSHPPTTTRCLKLGHAHRWDAFCCNHLRGDTDVQTFSGFSLSFFGTLSLSFLTSSSALMVLSCIISWKRSKLFVPMGCSSSNLHRATSWGRSRCSSVSSSSNSFENCTMSFVVGCSPVPRT